MTGGPSGPKWLWRSPLKLPAWEMLDDRQRGLFRAADMVAADAATRTAALAMAGLDRALPPPRGLWRGLHHPLTVKFPPVGAAIPLRRARAERQAALAIADETGGRPLSLPMIDLVRAAARHLVGAGDFRTAQISTDADPVGRHIVFPGPEHIAPQLARLDDFLDRSANAARSFRATVAALTIVNCHPLPDGNGRAARLAFNLIADPAHAPRDYYLPLHEIGVFSRGGYIVRLRQAELHGDWTPIAGFILAAARFWRRQVDAAPPFVPPTISMAIA